MGETDRPDGDSVADWHALVELGESHDEFGAVTDSLTSGGPPPRPGRSPLADAPMIIDTDIGGDPDDTVALAAAALTVPELALVITSDEYAGQRARFARRLLDLTGRHDVPVVTGSDLGNTRLYFVDELIPPGVPEQSFDLVAAVEEVCSGADGPVRWVGMGPLSNLSALQSDRPDLVDRMVVTQMGGAIKYRDPSRAEHNFRVDHSAAEHILSTVKLPTLVVSDVTFTPALEITTESPLYQRWASAGAPAWATVLKEHSDRWMARYPGSMQHDALTLAAALLWPGIRFAREHVVLDEIGRMSRADHGTEVRMSIEADYPEFMTWLGDRLS